MMIAITYFVGGSGAFACASGRLSPNAIASLIEKRGYANDGGIFTKSESSVSVKNSKLLAILSWRCSANEIFPPSIHWQALAIEQLFSITSGRLRQRLKHIFVTLFSVDRSLHQIDG
jgi:hypothetical protein